MYILSPGEKIKRLRKEMDLRQDELTDDQVTRSLISMIENGKRNLSYETAIIIAKGLSKHYESVGRVITADYLMESKETQVEKIIDNQLMSIDVLINNHKKLNCNDIHSIFDKLINLASRWSIKGHYSKILIKRGDFYYATSQYNNALMDYFNSLDYHLEVQDFCSIALIYNNIGNSFMMKGLADEALMYYNKACTTAEENNTSNLDDIKVLSTYNTICYYRTIKKFDLVFKYVPILKSIKNCQQELYHHVLLMEANTYRDLNNYEKAKVIYDELLREKSKLSNNNLLILYINLALLHKRMGNKKDTTSYSKKSTKVLEKEDLNVSPDLYFDLAKCYRDLAQVDRAIELLQKALKMAEILSNTDAIISIKLLLADIYRDHYNDLDEAEEHLLYIEDIIKKQGIKIKYAEVYAKLAKFYCLINQPARSIKFLDKLYA